MNYLVRFREETGINLRWAAYARLDTIRTKRQAQLFKDAGCIGLVFGIESFKKETKQKVWRDSMATQDMTL